MSWKTVKATSSSSGERGIAWVGVVPAGVVLLGVFVLDMLEMGSEKMERLVSEVECEPVCWFEMGM